MNPSDAETLTGGLLGAGLEPALAERIAAYGALLLAANRRTNLTGAKTAEALVSHLLDALTPLPYLQGPFVDIGSGGGLPAIPLAIATGFHVTMVEAIGKKAAFLREALKALGLPGEVVSERAEEAGRRPGLRENFAGATARAVAAAPVVLELAVPFLALGGLAVLQRGGMEAPERAAASDAAVMLGAAVAQEVSLAGERRLLLVRKVDRTPDRFPRRTGVPEKRPLCM